MQTESTNPLYPIFLKLHTLDMLIVGAGNVGFEKLFFILKNSPDAKITVVAPSINPEIIEYLNNRPGNGVKIIQREFRESDMQGRDLAIAATNIQALNIHVREVAKRHKVLVNVADTPDLCDFYLGSIVSRGPLKVAISTNGQSPTFAKRFRQVLEEILPNDVENLVANLKVYRDRLKGDFTEKVSALNKATAKLIE